MKKILLTTILILALSLVLGFSVFAAETVNTTYVDENNITWNVTLSTDEEAIQDGDLTIVGSATINSVTLTEMTKNGFVMPTYVTYEGETYVVTEIANNAFINNDLVFGKLTLPSKLKKIGDSAFQKTRIYSDVIIPETVDFIGSSAFREAYGLLSIKLPASITEIKTNTFYDCRSLVAVYAENNLKHIRSGAFQNCYALYEIPIGMGTLEINGSAFANCKAIEFQLNLTTLIKLDSNAFQNCINVESIILPNAIDFSLAPFNGCKSIEEYIVNPEAIYLSSESGVLYNKNKTIIYKYPSVKEGQSYVIPDTVTSIYADAFYGASELSSITLPKNITSIGNNAFRGTAIKTLFIPDTVITLGTYVLADCSSLEWVVISDKIASASSIVSNSPNVKYVIGRHATFSTSGTGIPSKGTCARANAFVCTEHFYGFLGTSATCDTSGVDICAVCNDSIYSKPLGHFGLILEKSELSCTTDNYIVIDCERCGNHYAKTVYEVAPGHKPAGKPTVIKPTATSLGYTITTCSVCEKTEISA